MAQVTNVTIEHKDGSAVEIAGEVPAEILQQYRRQVIADLGKDTEVPGFRPGHIPDAVLEKHLGEEKIMQETAQRALQDAYRHIVREHNVNAIGAPQVTITKLAQNNPLGFKIRTAVLPEVTLPDYPARAKEVLSAPREEMRVTQKEVDDVINEIRKSRARAQQQQNAEDTDDPSPQETPKEENVPALTDEFVRSLGDFTDVADFKTKIEENLKKEKRMREQEKRRTQIGDALVDNTSATIPDILIEGELNTMLAQFRNNIEQMGMQFDQYLSQAGKSEEEVRKEWREAAERRAKLQLILNAIAKQENIRPTDEEISHQVQHILEHNKDVDPERARIYVTTVLTNEKVLRFLESQGEENVREPTKEERADS